MALAAQALVHPQVIDVQTAAPGPAVEPGHDCTLLVTHKDAEQAAIAQPGLRHVVLVDALGQKGDILTRGLRDHAKLLFRHRRSSAPSVGTRYPVPLSRCWYVRVRPLAPPGTAGIPAGPRVPAGMPAVPGILTCARTSRRILRFCRRRNPRH